MGMINQQVTFLLVEDLERSTRFYQEAFGLEIVLDQGDCRILRVTDTAFVGICEREGPRDTDAVLVTFVTDDVDGYHRKLVTTGVPCEKDPQLNATYNVYHAFYRDPDGFLVEVQRFLDPAWPQTHSG
ncbi:MAG: VOC family protein [bacterium]|nr:VOC family protein [bacterium]MCP4965891.1 VOC family protein [bacterium]